MPDDLDTEQPSFPSRVARAAEQRDVPLATIVATVGVVVVVGLCLVLLWVLRADLLMIAVAAFIAILLSGPVRFFENRGLRRAWASGLVFLIGVVVIAGILFAFGYPLVDEVTRFANDAPLLVKQAQHGQGPIGHLIARLHLQHWVTQNAPKLKQFAASLAKPALSVGAAAGATLLRLVTIAVLSFYLLLDLPRIWRGTLRLFPERTAHRMSDVAHEASRGVNGYMAGNLLTSIIAGLVVFVSLTILRVPFAGLLALWVALVDLLPLVGGLLAGIPTVLVAFLHSTLAGIVMLIVFIVYQQLENHVLNPLVMSKTVRMSPLLVLLAVVIGATLGGRVAGGFGTFIGALVGVPVGSAIQSIVRAIRQSAPTTEEPAS